MKCHEQNIFLKRKSRSDSHVPNLKSKNLGRFAVPTLVFGKFRSSRMLRLSVGINVQRIAETSFA
jgi:hypothetical protein